MDHWWGDHMDHWYVIYLQYTEYSEEQCVMNDLTGLSLVLDLMNF